MFHQSHWRLLRFTPTAGANRVPGRGYGAVLVHPRKRAEISGGFRKTTNNRMELFAAIAGLELLKQPCKVTLFFRKLAGIVQDAIYELLELLGQRPAIDKSPRILQKWVMEPKTELRKREHRLLKGHATIEIWYNGLCLGTVTGADGPGVRVISQYPLSVREGIGTITQAVEIGIKTSEEN